MKRIVTVLGARPQFIKASVVSNAIRADSALREIVVCTGQHYDANMSDVFFDELGMAAPEHQLNVHARGHGAMTGRMLVAVERVLLHEKPDAVLVYGDTNSTLAGALAAVKLHIPVAHVEAGLRSFNPAMPEEINRVLTDRISRWLFTPTALAAQNLVREGVPRDQIAPVGDVMYDVALHYGASVSGIGRVLGRLELDSGTYVLTTVHRAENTDDPHRLSVIVDALQEVARRIPVVWPIHPRTRRLLQHDSRVARIPGTIRLIDPVGYLDMVQLEKHAAVIATDSGGVQKEAFFFKVPCVTLRQETEWLELVESGWNRLAPPTSATQVATSIEAAIGSRGANVMPYGAGDASAKIAARLGRDLLG